MVIEDLGRGWERSKQTVGDEEPNPKLTYSFEYDTRTLGLLWLV